MQSRCRRTDRHHHRRREPERLGGPRRLVDTTAVEHALLPLDPVPERLRNRWRELRFDHQRRGAFDRHGYRRLRHDVYQEQFRPRLQLRHLRRRRLRRLDTRVWQQRLGDRLGRLDYRLWGVQSHAAAQPVHTDSGLVLRRRHHLEHRLQNRRRVDAGPVSAR